MRQARRPPPPRQDEACLEQRQVEAGAVEGHDRGRPRQQRLERREQRRLVVEVAHEVLADNDAIAFDQGGADEERVGPCPAGQAGRLGVQEQQAAGPGDVALHTRGPGQDRQRRRHGVGERLGAVTVRQRVLALDEDDRALPGVVQLAVDDPLDRLGRRPGRASALDAPDHAPEVVDGRHRDQAVRTLSRRAAVALARRPTSLTGPTHDGHPKPHAHACSVPSPWRSRSGRISNRRSARPMPPAWAS